MTTRFEWDPQKAAVNLTKHNVSFATALRIFQDHRILLKRDQVVDGEQRWHALGRVDGLELLVVIHTYKEQDESEVIRMISARKAERWERRAYEEENG